MKLTYSCLFKIKSLKRGWLSTRASLTFNSLNLRLIPLEHPEIFNLNIQRNKSTEGKRKKPHQLNNIFRLALNTLNVLNKYLII